MRFLITKERRAAQSAHLPSIENQASSRFLNQVSSHGAGPCYVSLDRTGKYVLAANYDGGNVAVFPVLRDGRLGEISSEIKHAGPTVDPLGAEPHQIDLTPDNRFAITSYLGLDKLMVYSFDAAKGTLSCKRSPVRATWVEREAQALRSRSRLQIHLRT